MILAKHLNYVSGSIQMKARKTLPNIINLENIKDIHSLHISISPDDYFVLVSSRNRRSLGNRA